MKNDKAAQKLLYYSSNDRLMAILYRYTRDIKMSQDLLQETYIKVFSNLKHFDSTKGNFEAWTSKIAVNIALQFLRKKKEILIDKIPEEAFTIEPNLHDRMTISELKTVIDQLPEIHRIILNMYYYENYNHKEISEILGIKKSSSRSQLTRARLLLINKWSQLNTARI